MQRLTRASLFALALALGTSLLQSPPAALAHEHRDIAGGKYELTVGFITEPALQNEPNGIDLTVIDKTTNQPVEGVEKTLKATVAFGGGQPKEFPLRTRFRMPGKYTADLIPTRAGTYIFTFSGTIDGAQVNERFESGPGRFNDVQSVSELQFPVANPAPSDLQQAVSEARAQAATANTMGMAGLALGIVALLLAGYSILSRRAAGAPARAVARQGGGAD
jgi:hypothetical protein